MLVNLNQLHQGLLNFDASNETWNTTVTEAFNTLKSDLNISDDYVLNIEQENPFQSLQDQLNEMITVFQRFLNDQWLQPLKLTIQEFKILLGEILALMDNLRGAVNVLVDKIAHYTATNFGSLQFFKDLFNEDVDAVRSFFFEVTSSIIRIGIIVIDFIDGFRDRIGSTLISTVKAISTVKIETPSYKLIKNTEVDVVNQFN